MNQDDSKDDKDLFKTAMQNMGVNEQRFSTQEHIKKTPPKEKRQTKTIHTAAQNKHEYWPEILYKDIQSEIVSQDTSNISPQLRNQSSQFQSGGINIKKIKQLKKGQFRIASQLDLHGMTVDESIQALNETINTIELDKQACLLIIHGKGYHSQDNTPKLKNLTEGWLKSHPRTLAYSSAQAKDGGTGALYVLLRSNKR